MSTIKIRTFGTGINPFSSLDDPFSDYMVIEEVSQNDTRFSQKRYLSNNGVWISIVEGAIIPNECIFEVEV